MKQKRFTLAVGPKSLVDELPVEGFPIDMGVLMGVKGIPISIMVPLAIIYIFYECCLWIVIIIAGNLQVERIISFKILEQGAAWHSADSATADQSV